VTECQHDTPACRKCADEDAALAPFVEEARITANRCGGIVYVVRLPDRTCDVVSADEFSHKYEALIRRKKKLIVRVVKPWGWRFSP
jgi:hypothetical protein